MICTGAFCSCAPVDVKCVCAGRPVHIPRFIELADPLPANAIPACDVMLGKQLDFMGGPHKGRIFQGRVHGAAQDSALKVLIDREQPDELQLLQQPRGAIHQQVNSARLNRHAHAP